MYYTKSDILEFMKENDVKFIRLAFFDVFGLQKNMAITSLEMERALEMGMPVDACEIRGFGTGTVYLFPDLSTLSLLPWRPSTGRVIRFFCDLFDEKGEPFVADGRRALKMAEGEDSRSPLISARCDFYLFKLGEDGEATSEPFDRAGYMDIAPLDKCENVRREICLTLEEMGISPLSSCHAAGPGQNSVCIGGAGPLKAADNISSLKSVIQTISARNGVYADLSALPVKGWPANALRLFIKGADSRFASGVQACLSGLSYFLQPDERSYPLVPAGETSPLGLSVFASPLFNQYAALSLLLLAGREGQEPLFAQPAPLASRKEAKEAADSFLKELPPEYKAFLKEV